MIVAAGSEEHAVCITGAGKEDIQGSIFQIHLPGWPTLRMLCRKSCLVMAVMTSWSPCLACLQAGSQTFQPDQIAV